MPNQTTHPENRSFFVAVELLPNHLKEWSAFKDLVRKFLPSNQPGWTVVEAAENGYYSGTFSVKTESDSHIVYQKLVRYNEKGTRLLVHRFDTSGNVKAELLECNCQDIYGVDHMYQSRSSTQVQRSLIMASQQQQPMYSYPPTYGWTQPANQMHSLTDGFQNLAVGQVPYATAYYTAPLPQQQQQQHAVGQTYVRNMYGLPVNVTNGAIHTECREVHISNINFRVKKKELYEQISRIATPITLDMHQDHAGKFKGSAVATFESGEDANEVVAQLDRTEIKTKKLKVRLGKQQTPVNQAPLVVHSSTGY